MSKVVETKVAPTVVVTQCRVKNSLFYRILLCLVVVIHLIVSVLSIARFFDLAYICTIYLETNEDATDPVQMAYLKIALICLMGILVSILHIMMASFAFAAETKKNPNLFVPWIVYLHFYEFFGLLICFIAHLYFGVQFRYVSNFILWFLFASVTRYVTTSRKVAMENEIRHSSAVYQLLKDEIQIV